MSTVITGYRNSSGVTRIKLPAAAAEFELNKEEKQVSTGALLVDEQRTAFNEFLNCCSATTYPDSH